MQVYLHQCWEPNLYLVPYCVYCGLSSQRNLMKTNKGTSGLETDDFSAVTLLHPLSTKLKNCVSYEFEFSLLRGNK